MIKLKLTRDEARFIDRDMIPFMLQLSAAALKAGSGSAGLYLNALIIRSLLLDIELLFKKKLLGTAVNLTFNFSRAHASVLYVYMMKRPIDEDRVWSNLVRQNLCNQLHKQLFANLSIQPSFADAGEWQFTAHDY